jgi:hypothetical protein
MVCCVEAHLLISVLVVKALSGGREKGRGKGG